MTTHLFVRSVTLSQSVAWLPPRSPYLAQYPPSVCLVQTFNVRDVSPKPFLCKWDLSPGGPQYATTN